MKKTKKKAKVPVSELLKKKNLGIKLDIGCGHNKQGKDWVGIDYTDQPGVDIVHDVTKFPWPLPDESVSVAAASHLVEHLNPMAPDPRLVGLIDLLVDKKIISAKDKEAYIGEHNIGPVFMRFMDEVWRVLKPGGEFIFAFPYAGSQGFYQDPTHINQRNEITWDYFDPQGPFTGGNFYDIYKPKPWKVKINTWRVNGVLEVVLVKRPLI